MLSVVLLFITSVLAMPEFWIHGCQPAVKDIVMSTHVKDDKDTNKCNLTLSADGFTPLRSIVDTSATYRISFRPNFGSSQLHCLLSTTSGVIGLNNGSYGYKENCLATGISAVLWKGHTDDEVVENISFNFTPAAGQVDIKFLVTCSEGIGSPVYQHALFIGNYTLPPFEDFQSSVALAVVVLLMIILPIVGIGFYCAYLKVCKNRGVPPPSVGKDDDEDEEDEKPQKKTKKYDNIKDED